MDLLNFLADPPRRHGTTMEMPERGPESLAPSADPGGPQPCAIAAGCELADGARLEAAIERLFANPQAAYLHIHFAAAGCYAACVERA